MVRRLGHDGDATLVRVEPPTAVLVRPQRHPVEEVDEPVAVRPDDGHLPRRLDQIALQRSAVIRFQKAGCVTHGAAGTDLRQLGDGVDGGMPIDADEYCVRRSGKLGDGPERGTPPDSAALRCTGHSAPSNPILSHCSATRAASRPPMTATLRGRTSRANRSADGTILPLPAHE